MGLSDRIEAFITELLKDEDSWLELKRNELANVFGCAPSQINYVISTRFNTDRGYAVESRRGGGGYLRIKRINSDNDNIIYNTVISIKDSMDYSSLKSVTALLLNQKIIDEKTAGLILFGLSDNAICISEPQKSKVRAGIVKNILSALE